LKAFDIFLTQALAVAGVTGLRNPTAFIASALAAVGETIVTGRALVTPAQSKMILKKSAWPASTVARNSIGQKLKDIGTSYAYNSF